MERNLKQIFEITGKQEKITKEDARKLIRLISKIFRMVLLQGGHNARQITRLTTKFRDAGRRSAPWRPTSKRVPGRPQDGEDGNRINRWLLPVIHKFYAEEITATLSEIKYYLQALSMDGAPNLSSNSIQNCFFPWLIEHPVEPGRYLDPIQLIPINLHEVVNDARIIQSGHLIPLDRGGKHEPRNVFLMLARSNQLQGNLTVDKLIELMDEIVKRHRARNVQPSGPTV